MSFSCAQCRTRLTTGQTICQCGQVFSHPVPEFSESYNTMYWPPASASQPAALNWWTDLSPAIKASAAGGIVLVVVLFAVGGSVHQYQTMHARYAPGKPVMVASAAPVRVQVPSAPASPLAEAPLVVEAAPRYVPPTKISQPYSPPANQQTMASDPTALAQANAAWKDSQNVLNEATREQKEAMNSSGRISPNWDTLSRQMLIDKNAVELAKGRLSPNEYANAANGVAEMEQLLADAHNTWDTNRPLMFPGSN